MKWILILMSSVFVAFAVAHFVPASNSLATTIGSHPVQWWAIAGGGFAVFCLLASKKLK